MTLALGLAACAPPEDVERSETALEEDTVAADSSDSADTAAPAATRLLRDPMPLTLAIRSSPALRGTAEVFSECRVVPGDDGAAQYEVATTTGDFEGGPAALGLIVSGFSGPGVYEQDVTVTLVLGRAAAPRPDLRAGRTGCIVRVENLQTGSFSCESPPDSAPAVSQGATDTTSVSQIVAELELLGTGSWRCR